MENEEGSAARRREAMRSHESACTGWDAPPWHLRQDHRGLGWTVAEAESLLGRLAGDGAVVTPHRFREGFVYLLPIPLTAAAEASAAERERLRPLLSAVRALLPGRAYSDAAVPFRNRIDVLLGDVPQDGAGLRADLLDDLDGYGPSMRRAHAGLLSSPGVAALLVHARSLGQVRPTKRWQKRATELTAAAPRGAEAVRALVTGLAAQPENEVVTFAHSEDGWRFDGIVSDGNAVLARGLIWIAAALDEAWVVPAVGEIARSTGTGVGGSGGWCRSQPVATGAAAALGSFGGEQGAQAIQALARVKDKVRNRTVLKGVARAVADIAERSGITPAQLRERSIPDAGLDAAGVRRVTLGAYTAVLAVTPDRAAELSFRGPAGAVLKSAPKQVREAHKEELTGLRAELKQLRSLLASERQRLEDQLAAGTVWPATDWRRYYRDHPVTGVFTRALLWESSGDGGGTWQVTLGGDGVKDGDLVRLWHPVRAGSGETLALREELTGRELRQPFKQAFREIYLLTPAEEGTRGYSNRFAAHLLRYPQARALMVERGWLSHALGYHSEGYAAEAVKELPPAGHLPGARTEFWRARFFIELVESDEERWGVPALCATDQVRFERRRGPRGEWTAADVTEVPQPALSEALRDVDLFVGVASIGADPEWHDRGAERTHDYWRRYSFGELGESALIRREALARLLPRTKLADRTELDDRWLRVRGSLRTYRIHLGSGNILMEPDDAYLCIVADRVKGRSPGKVFLPFEEGMLSVILSKAFLLADDARITDETILGQISR
ncbi:DUF4132 domain-containing protein [Streptomyces sp. NPDC051940]|uniref:DUF4132 domain-containing protein n=1 Tax=Streptomyces sp. NPDC051940 TaxID=3155675 RepID=UPI003413EE1C